MFYRALPIWLENKENEKNIQAKFKAEFVGEDNCILRITGATFYKVFLNERLIHYGPAPTADGYARVDVVSLDANAGSKNTIVIEAAGYNCYSYAAVRQTSYVCAEVVADGRCLAATGFDFEGYYVSARIRNVLRYSFQRHFTEIWDFTKDDIAENVKALELDIRYMERKAPLPDMHPEEFNEAYSKDTFKITENDWKILSLQGAVDNIGDTIDGFSLNEIDRKPIKEFASFEYKMSANKVTLPLKLKKGEFAAFECCKNTCALINLKYKASENTRIIIAFDEKLKDGRFDYENWEMFNVIEVTSSGETNFTNFEIYGFKYFAVFALEGSLELSSVGIVNMVNPIYNPPKLNCDEEVVLKIYDAACQSARCNSLGVFMDCPTRERAGWLCDSYYTAQAMHKLEGNTFVEDDFVENFALAKCRWLPEGMLPMCYPADHPNGNHIPQWAMWYILELNQYKDRNTSVDICEFKDLAYKLLCYFKGFENEYSLLEDLPGWNFVEWSKANDWTAGINFPTNMLYSFICKIIGSWFDDAELVSKSERIKEKVIEMSFDGKFFRDQALRNENGVPVLCNHISEVCQYYAFMFDIADIKGYNSLYNTMVTEFTPESNVYPDVERANALMGLYMRMELLFNWGHHEQLVKEIKAYFGHMSDITGTLWEHKNMASSLNHGFTSYLCILLLEIYK